MIESLRNLVPNRGARASGHTRARTSALRSLATAGDHGPAAAPEPATLDHDALASGGHDRATANRPHLPYRPGLDGLRALAVAGVFLYHANVSWAPGGFLGVDVFFVLSGYLITSLLLSERGAGGRIDLRAFWARRARRLLPAVLLVVVFALIATSTIARDDLSRTRADAVSALVYMTNWRQIIASHSYFNSFGRPSLLQHLWSLAVEEQFYLLWPLLLIAGLRWLGRRWTIACTLLLAVCSVALMWLLYNPEGDPSRVYYGTDTRAFTLLVGAILAFAWPAVRMRGNVARHATWLLDAIGLAALLGVLAFFWRVHDYDPWMYRGGFLLVAVCAAILVAVIVHPASRLGDLLGHDPLRWLGVRSYGIYLWHWPIMQLTRPGIDVPWHGPLLIACQGAATVAVAALSYRFVEMPIRAGTAQRRLRAWLDARSPHQRLGWVAGGALTVVLVLGLAFGLPAPTTTAAGSQRTATPAALARNPTIAGPLGRSSDTGQTGGGAGPNAHASGTPRAAGHGPGGTAAPNGGGTGAGSLPMGQILALGDSVMLGCAEDLERRLGRRLHVDAVVGRQAEETIDRLAEYKANGGLPSTVIVQIGDNGPVWYSNMQHLRKVLTGVPRVVLVNVRVARSWQNEVNNELAQYVRTWPQAVIANWYADSTESMLVDGVHPSVPARNVYAKVLVDALREVTRKSR